MPKLPGTTTPVDLSVSTPDPLFLLLFFYSRRGVVDWEVEKLIYVISPFVALFLMVVPDGCRES